MLVVLYSFSGKIASFELFPDFFLSVPFRVVDLNLGVRSGNHLKPVARPGLPALGPLLSSLKNFDRDSSPIRFERTSKSQIPG